MNKKIFFIIIGSAAALIVILIIVFSVHGPSAAVQRFLNRFFPTAREKIIPVVPPQRGAALPEGAATTTPLQAEKFALTQISKNAISGAAFYKTKVRFIEKSTGHLYESGPQGEKLTRLSNTTIPKIFDVSWSKNKDHAVLKYLQDNNLRILSASFTGSSTQGVFLDPQISTIAASPDEDKIFYLMPTETINVGIIASFEDKNKKQIITLPFGDFMAAWPAKNFISLLTRPSAFSDGFLYSLGLDGSFTKILGGLKGLQALWSPKGDKLLISYVVDSGGTELALFDPKQKSFSVLPVKTLAEKCVWSKKEDGIIYCGAPAFPIQAVLPDDWFKGLVSFTDKIVKISTKNNETMPVFPEIILYSMDLTNPFLSDDENFLFFINKTDNTLWSLRIK